MLSRSIQNYPSIPVSRLWNDIIQVFVITCVDDILFVRMICLRIKNMISSTYLIEVVDIFFFLYYVAAEIFSK